MNKQQLEAKWWHRFFKVILVVSTIVWVFVLIAFGINEGGFTYRETKNVYSFESDYKEYTAKEVKCLFLSRTVQGSDSMGRPTTWQLPQLIECGSLVMDKSSFMSLYCKYDPTESFCVNPEEYGLGGKLISLEEVGLKQVTYTNWKSTFISWALSIGVILGWIALLKYGIYKAILYIAYGRD